MKKLASILAVTLAAGVLATGSPFVGAGMPVGAP